MRVGYDGRIMASRRPTGIGIFTREVISTLGRFGQAPRMTIYTPREDGGEYPWSGDAQVVRSVVPGGLREDRFFRLWYDGYLPFRIWRDRLDIFHGPSFLAPRSRRAKTVVTVPDLTHEKYPALAPGCSPEVVSRARESAACADAIVALSKATRDDLMEIYGVPEEKIRVIYGGIDPRFTPSGKSVSADAFKKKYGLTEPFICTVASLHPRKNLEGLLHAVSLLQERPAACCSLVVAGKRYGSVDIEGEARRHGIGERFRYLGYLPVEELPLLYQAAELFVFPSFYEGFGMPPLEAMACGTPVAAAGTGSLPEVLGDAARYFDPHNLEEMASVITTILLSKSERTRMSARGQAHAAHYRWEKTACHTLALYRELV